MRTMGTNKLSRQPGHKLNMPSMCTAMRAQRLVLVLAQPWRKRKPKQRKQSAKLDTKRKQNV